MIRLLCSTTRVTWEFHLVENLSWRQFVNIRLIMRSHKKFLLNCCSNPNKHLYMEAVWSKRRVLFAHLNIIDLLHHSPSYKLANFKWAIYAILKTDRNKSLLYCDWVIFQFMSHFKAAINAGNRKTPASISTLISTPKHKNLIRLSVRIRLVPPRDVEFFIPHAWNLVLCV